METSVGRVVLSFLLPAGVCVNIDPLPLLLAGGKWRKASDFPLTVKRIAMVVKISDYQVLS